MGAGNRLNGEAPKLRKGAKTMLLLTQRRSDGTLDLLVVLGDDNIARIKQYDHVEFNWQNFPPAHRNCAPRIIAVGYATSEELKEIERLSNAGKSEEAFALLTRGWKYQPDKGDHDFGPIVLGRPTEGTKH